MASHQERRELAKLAVQHATELVLRSVALFNAIDSGQGEELVSQLLDRMNVNACFVDEIVTELNAERFDREHPGLQAPAGPAQSG